MLLKSKKNDRSQVIYFLEFLKYQNFFVVYLRRNFFQNIDNMSIEYIFKIIFYHYNFHNYIVVIRLNSIIIFTNFSVTL